MGDDQKTTEDYGLPHSVLVFLDLSVALTGFDRAELLGTGLVTDYYDTLLRAIGEREGGKLLQAAEDNLADPDDFEEFARNPRYGPVAVSIIKLWYLGSWTPLAQQWRDRYGATAYDVQHVVSAHAYQEGLVWPAAGAHPMGAKPGGYGSWAVPSSVPTHA